MQSPWGFFLAFLFVLALIGGAAYLARRFAGSRLGASTNRGRAPRLAVIDAAAVDGRRRLVLVRRDNIEHLLMIGGPTDIVVEPNIVRAAPAREQAAPPRAVLQPQEPAGWTEHEPLELGEPAPQAELQRPPRAALPDEPPRRPQAQRAPEPRPRPLERPVDRSMERPGDPFANMISDTSLRAEPAMREPRAPMPQPARSEPIMPRNESAAQRSEPLVPRQRQAEPAPPKAPPVRAPERGPAAPTASSADQNLAEMAQRLEAALRRPNGEDRAPPVAPETPRAARPAQSEPAPEPQDSAPKTQFKNLEEEMASLLGRPKSQT